MVIARRNGHHVDRTGRTVGLAIIVVSPTDDRAIGLERQTVPIARRKGQHFGRAGGNGGLAVRVPSPAGDGAVGLERQTVIIARCDCEKRTADVCPRVNERRVAFIGKEIRAGESEGG